MIGVMKRKESKKLKVEQLLLERLKKYADSDAYPFHMPGHKRQVYEGGFPDPFSIDITEIDGFDNLHHPEGILKESMKWAAKVYGADKTYYLVNGSSGGILSAIFATVDPGGKILMSRNCHKSAYHGVMLGNLKKVDVYPQTIEALGITGGISVENVDKILKCNPGTKAVLIVSPTYDGIVSNIPEIAKVVHAHGIPLIVDEAHGAHFSFGKDIFPKSALECGADLVIQSLHKTLPSLTQTAVLHVKNGYVDIGRLEKYLQMFQTSSPSYILMASIEKCIFEMWKDGAGKCRKLMNQIEILRKDLHGLQNIRLLDRSFCGTSGVFDVDESKFVISVKNCFRPASDKRALRDEDQNKHFKEDRVISPEYVHADGVWLADILRDQYHLEMEMAGADYVLAIITCYDTAEGLARLKKALFEIDETLIVKDFLEQKLEEAWEKPRKVMELAEASASEWEELCLSECEGRISTEFIYLYPPGIPIAAPGEVITGQIIARVEEYRKNGFPIQGMADMESMMLRVIKNKMYDMKMTSDKEMRKEGSVR